MSRVSSILCVLIAAAAGCRGPLDAVPKASPLDTTPSLNQPQVSLVQHVEPLPSSLTPHSERDHEPAPEQPIRTVGQPRELDDRLPSPARELSGQQPGESRTLTLAEVSESVYFAYPGLEAALRELEIAAGKQQSAQGEFDLKLKAGSLSDPLGFYQTYKNAIKLEQALWQGGGVYGQYRMGRGKFPTWDGLETNDGGEFKIGVLQPLLQNSAIDQRRADVLQATLRRQQVEPAVRSLLLELVRAAADSYWNWVAAGQAYDAQSELLRVTLDRNKAYEGRVEAGDLPRVELLQNQRLIASREAKLVEAERKLQQSAIKLSLYLRDEAGQPLVPAPKALPNSFPAPRLPSTIDVDDVIANSLADRPELQELEIVREQIQVDLAQARNLRLPDVTATLDAAQDVGAPTPKGDKSPFQLQAGLFLDVPLARNKALGKIRESQAKLAQLTAKRQLLENKIVTEVQDAISAWTTSHARFRRARENTQLSLQLVNAERERFEAEDSDLLRVAIQEAAAIEAKLAEIDALADFFKAEAAYRAATAADPLDSFDLSAEPIPTPRPDPAARPK